MSEEAQEKLLKLCSIYTQSGATSLAKANEGSPSSSSSSSFTGKPPYTLEALKQKLRLAGFDCDFEESIQQKEQSSLKDVKQGEEKEEKEEMEEKEEEEEQEQEEHQEEEQELEEEEEQKVFEDQMEADVEESVDLEEEEVDEDEDDDYDDDDEDRMEAGGFPLAQGSCVFEKTRTMSRKREALQGSAWQVSSEDVRWGSFPLGQVPGQTEDPSELMLDKYDTMYLLDQPVIEPRPQSQKSKSSLRYGGSNSASSSSGGGGNTKGPLWDEEQMEELKSGLQLF